VAPGPGAVGLAPVAWGHGPAERATSETVLPPLSPTGPLLWDSEVGGTAGWDTPLFCGPAEVNRDAELGENILITTF